MDSVLIISENDYEGKALDLTARLSTVLDVDVRHSTIDEVSSNIPEGVDRVFVIPLVPSKCGFSDECIPDAIGIGSGNREGVVNGTQFLVTEPFGMNPGIRDVLYDNVIPLEPEAGTTCIVLTGVVNGNRDDTLALKEWAALIRGFNIDAFYAFEGGEPSPGPCFMEMVELGYKHMVTVPVLSSPDMDSVTGIDTVVGEDLIGSEGAVNLIAKIVRKAMEKGTVLPPVRQNKGSVDSNALNSLIQRLKQNQS